MNEEEKLKTIEAYNLFAEDFSKKFSAFSPTLIGYLDFFLVGMSGSMVLDIGAGDGTAALYIKTQGINSVCIDLSVAMVDIMKSRGLDARLMDMERMDFSDESFDGILALSSLMSIPKVDLPQVIKNISCMLKPGGKFAAFITKGEGEGMEIDERYPGTERWFSYYSFKELREIFSPYFDIIEMKDSPTSARPWIFTLCKKR